MTKLLKSFDIENYFVNKARQVYTSWSCAREWRIYILLTALLRLLTAFVSIYCGFYFLYINALNFVSNPSHAVIIAILLLFILEGLNNLTLIKLFKFSFKGRVSTAIAMIAALLLFFSTSFFISTNGIELKVKADMSKLETITDNSTLEIEGIKTEYQQQIQDIKQEIILLKKNKWKGKLSRYYINLIKQYNDQMKQLRSNQRSEIKEIEAEKVRSIEVNSKDATAAGNKYYRIVLIIMFLQIISNAVLIYFYKLIRAEKDPESELSEKTDNILGSLLDSTFNLFEQRINFINNIVQKRYQEQMNEYEIKILNNSDASKIIEPGTSIGFLTTNETKETIKDNENRNDNRTNIESKVKSNIRTCKHCNAKYTYKHHKQMYCCSECRQQAWQKKTGRKLYIK